MKITNKSLFLFSVLSILGITSCLKDDSVIGPDAKGAIKNVVEFKNIVPISSTPTAPYALFVPQTLDPEQTKITINAIVRYAGVNDAPSDITINLGLAAEAVTEYNKSQSSSYFQLPASAFEMPTSVTIKKGEREAQVPIVFKTAGFDPTKSNVLAFKISSVSGGETISGNFGTVIYSLPLKSIWEGTYTYTVTNDYGQIDPAIGGTYTEAGIKVATVGPNLVQMTNLWQTYSGYSQYQFNATNSTITNIIAFSGSIRAATIDKVVLVDPENRIFEINWTAINRGVRERFVRTGD